MNFRCELCEKDAHNVCSGLDVPALYFCDACSEIHNHDCPDLYEGRSWWLRVADPPKGGELPNIEYAAGA